MSETHEVNHINLSLPMEQITELCQKYGVKKLSVFGSVLREDFHQDSDIDFLVIFENDDYGPWMSKLTNLAEELSQLLGRKVDLVPKEMLKWVIRDRVLADAELIYENR